MLSKKSRQAASVALVALAVLGLRAASAAGADLPGGNILIGNDGATQCSTAPVTIDYDVAYDAALRGHAVSAARLSGLDEHCAGYEAVVTLQGPAGAPLAELTGVVDGSDLRLVVPAGSPVGAEGLTGVSLVLKEAGA